MKVYLKNRDPFLYISEFVTLLTADKVKTHLQILAAENERDY